MVTRSWTNEPPAHWQDMLDRLAPPGPHLSSLRVTWHPGYPPRGAPADQAEQLERFVIYQIMPPQFTPALFWHPRTAWSESAPRFDLDTTLLDTVQTRLFRETGCYAQPLWALQGSQGGHPWRYSQAEKMLAMMRELPERPPALGDLGFCGLDRRTMDALQVRDAFLQWEQIGDFLTRTGATIEQDEAESLRSARSQFWSWSEARMRADVDEYSRAALLRAADELPRVLVGRDDRRRLAHTRPDLEQARHDFIHETGVLAA